MESQQNKASKLADKIHEISEPLLDLQEKLVENNLIEISEEDFEEITNLLDKLVYINEYLKKNLIKDNNNGN